MVPESNASQTTRVTFDQLARLPVERLARLLLERASEDPMLLSRLNATLEESARITPRRIGPDRRRLIGSSLPMQQVAALLERFVRTDEPILITGESGTGKELVARTIHESSGRKAGPFVAVNCAAIPASLVASELFGYEKGAFTGAAARTRGQLEHAHGGTLFLDEIGDMPIDLQGHLLRFLQEGQIVRVGGREAIDLDVRVVSATNVRLRQAMAEGRFREDLYYRLNVLSVQLPALRERRDDIESLARHFLSQAVQDFKADVTDFEPEALDLLRCHHWPGNVRELMSMVRRAVLISESGRIGVADLTGLDEAAPPRDAPPRYAPRRDAQPGVRMPARPGSQAERAALLDALQRSEENITLTAHELGVSRVTLYRMLRRHRITLNRGLQEAPSVARAQRSDALITAASGSGVS